MTEDIYLWSGNLVTSKLTISALLPASLSRGIHIRFISVDNRSNNN